jgi:L(+)-tartrate dehydratase beta subunit
VGYGLGARYGQSITKVSDVFWKEELGLAQAMWVLDVKHFGPLLVDCDTEGNSLQAIAKEEVDKVFSPLRDSYPLPTLKRHGEISAFTEDII